MQTQLKITSLLLALLMVFSFSAFAANNLTVVSATYNGADLEGATVPAGSEIVLTFSNNVTDASVLAGNIGKIKVKNAEGTPVSAPVSVGTDQNTFIVTLGDLEKGDYTLELGKELTAKNGSTLGEKVAYSFTVKGSGSGDGTGGGNNPLDVEAITVDGAALEGAELDGSALIVIQFSRGMTENAEANAKLIRVLGADGKEANYTVISPESKDDKNFVKVQLNALEGGSYTLVLDKDIKANNGNTLGEDVTVAFIVKATAPQALTPLERVRAFFADLLGRVQGFFAPVIRILQSIYFWLLTRIHLPA